jgi:hypothetical protein
MLGGCKPEYPACKKDKHCKQDLGETCIEGSCQNCKTDAESVGKAPDGGNCVCSAFRCQDPALVKDGAGGGGNEGDPCTQRMDCFGGLACIAGKCAGCTDDIECSPTTCTVETGRCNAAGQCTTDDECPMDEICDGGMCIYPGDVGGGEVCGLDAVYFGFDSDTLTPKNQELLTAAAKCLVDGGTSVILEAHADNVGTEEYNILLTDRRGNSVTSFLEAAGVPGEQLQVVGKGALEATGSTESERSKDRRVQLVAAQ